MCGIEHPYFPNPGLWAWLTYILLDVLFPKKDGIRKVGEIHKWYPAMPNDWQKSQRHLVRMPVLLFSVFGNDADHLLCGKPSVPGELREQLTSQQDMFSANFVRACKLLYYDTNSGSLKKGAGGKLGGAARRLAKVRTQLDVTWDMTDLGEEKIVELLPCKFDKFKLSGLAA